MDYTKLLMTGAAAAVLTFSGFAADAKAKPAAKGGAYTADIDGAKVAVEVNAANGTYTAKVNGKSYTVKLADGIDAAAASAAPAAKSAGAASPLTTPLPGTVMRIEVKAGQAVKNGDTIMILEAMKMETPVTADRDGVVASIEVAVGDVVGEGDTLVMIG